MTERDALYAAVLAEPEADAPRLVYADWLEEHPRGEADLARANFIRLEIEAESWPNDSPEREQLETTAAKLFNQFGTIWNLELPTWDEWYDSTLLYQRGFPHELRTRFRKLYFSGGKLFQVAPIQSLVVSERSGSPSWYSGLIQSVVGQLPDLSGLHSLWVGPRMNLGGSSEGVRTTFRIATQYPSLSNLHRLSFAGCNLDDDGVLMLDRALREAVFLETLEELDLSDNNIQSNGGSSLSVVPSLARIHRLVLTGNPLSSLSRRMLRNQFGDRVVM